MNKANRAPEIISTNNLQVITSGMAAVALLIAEATLKETSCKTTIADAAYLLSDLAEIVQDVTRRA